MHPVAMMVMAGDRFGFVERQSQKLPLSTGGEGLLESPFREIEGNPRLDRKGRSRLPKSNLANFFGRLARLLLDCKLCIFNHLPFRARVTLPLCRGRVPSPGIFLSGNNAFVWGIIEEASERIGRKSKWH